MKINKYKKIINKFDNGLQPIVRKILQYSRGHSYKKRIWGIKDERAFIVEFPCRNLISLYVEEIEDHITIYGYNSASDNSEEKWLNSMVSLYNIEGVEDFRTAHMLLSRQRAGRQNPLN